MKYRIAKTYGSQYLIQAKYWIFGKWHTLMTCALPEDAMLKLSIHQAECHWHKIEKVICVNPHSDAYAYARWKLKENC